MTKRKDWSWEDDHITLHIHLWGFPHTEEEAKDLFRGPDYTRYNEVYTRFRGLRSKIARHREVFGTPYGCYQGPSVRSWVWRLDSGLAVWISTRGIGITVPQTMGFEESRAAYRDWLDHVLR